MKSHKVFKKQLHPNRYLFWAVAFAVFAGIALYGYVRVYIENYGADNYDSLLVTPRTKLYIDKKRSFSVKYPYNWHLDQDSKGNIIFEHPTDPDQYIMVSMAKLNEEAAIRKSLNILSEQKYDKDNFKVAFIAVGNHKDIGRRDAAIIKTKLRLYYITAGHQASLGQFVNSFKPM